MRINGYKWVIEKDWLTIEWLTLEKSVTDEKWVTRNANYIIWRTLLILSIKLSKDQLVCKGRWVTLKWFSTEHIIGKREMCL